MGIVGAIFQFSTQEQTFEDTPGNRIYVLKILIQHELFKSSEIVWSD